MFVKHFSYEYWNRFDLSSYLLEIVNKIFLVFLFQTYAIDSYLATSQFSSLLQKGRLDKAALMC